MVYRVLVTGSRDWKDHDPVVFRLQQARWDAQGPMVVVHGACATGVDAIASWWCKGFMLRHGNLLEISEERHPADWPACGSDCPDRPHRKVRRDGVEYCPLAGHRRNQAMVDLGASLCLAFPLGRSRGTYDCMRRAHAAGIEVRTVTP